MVAELPALLDAGVRIVGGCCGSTPAHIRLFRKVIDEHAKH
jgi:methionine synthase I (cobalamin-dependent)